jgi:zinc protease
MRAMSLFRFPAILFGAFMTLALVHVPARAVTVQEITSPGGITAWLVEDYTVPIVSMNIAFRGGSAQDPEGLAGLANLMSGTLDEGAGALDSRAFQARLEDLSITLSFDAGSDAFYGNLRTLATNADEAFELFRLAVNEPRFDEEPVERIRGQVLAGLRQAETNPNEMAGRLWAETLFGNHPYGNTVEGTTESVTAITADDLRAFHERTMAQDNLYVVIVGAIDRAAAEAALDHMFGALPEQAALAPVPEVVPVVGATAHEELNSPQTVIRLGGIGLTRDDPDFVAAYVADQILGGGVFSSRLYNAVREERGLAYSVGSGLIPYDHAGAFIAATSVDATNVDMAVQIMLDEIERYATEGPTGEELAAAQDYLVGNFALRFDSSQKIARNLLQFQLDNLGIDYIERRNELIRAVTIEDIRRVAERIWGNGVTVVTVGPQALTAEREI